jgi:hypothetical protein
MHESKSSRRTHDSIAAAVRRLSVLGGRGAILVTNQNLPPIDLPFTDIALVFNTE